MWRHCRCVGEIHWHCPLLSQVRLFGRGDWCRFLSWFLRNFFSNDNTISHQSAGSRCIVHIVVNGRTTSFSNTRNRRADRTVQRKSTHNWGIGWRRMKADQVVVINMVDLWIRWQNSGRNLQKWGTDALRWVDATKQILISP